MFQIIIKKQKNIAQYTMKNNKLLMDLLFFSILVVEHFFSFFPLAKVNNTKNPELIKAHDAIQKNSRNPRPFKIFSQ
jgi:hypothetical protein